ncbi:MAG: polysaccharide lyase family 8 super-sandwich domain-containing protein, partial [Bacteroidota bacterium]
MLLLLRLLLPFLVLSSVCAQVPSSLQLIQQRITDQLLVPEIVEAEIQSLLETIREDGTWPGINYEDVSRTAFEHRYHYRHLLKLAQAYRKEDSPFEKNEQVLKTLEQGLQHWAEQDYICDNWWYNQIGTPDGLVKVFLLVGKELDPTLVENIQPIIGRAHVNAPGARPGGDRIKIAGIQAKQALANGDAATFEKVVRIIEGEIKFSDWVGAQYGYGFRDTPGGFRNRKMGGRGIQHDFSFHHRADGVNNTLSYGLGYAAAFAEWAGYVAGTEYAFSEEKTDLLIDYFLDGICKTAVFGKYPDPAAKNRSISRKGRLGPYSAALAHKLASVSDHRRKEMQEIIAIRESRTEPRLSHATYYWHSEHFSFQRPEWFASVRLYSTRTYNMEEPYNSEGLLNHHRGDGANHVSVRGDEYFDIWPAYDYQKIPGATILQKPSLPEPNQIQRLGLTDFVGAATDGSYGTVAFDFRSAHDPLIARKSWFFFDEQYVCLGAGISSPNRDLPVVTTLNQSLLNGEIILQTSEKRLSPESGQQDYAEVEWLYHDQVGYAFPQSTPIQLFHGARTGSWQRINQQTDSPTDSVEVEVFQLWLDHGNRPREARYA